MEEKKIFKLGLRICWVLFVIFFAVFSTSSYYADSVAIQDITLQADTWETGKVVINEVYYDPIGAEPDEEWIEIYNSSNQAIDLTGYKIGDEETLGGGEGMYQFPTGTVISGNGFLVIANKASAFFNLYGFLPDFEINETNPAVPNLSKYSVWSTGSLNLSNSGDEVLLLNSSDSVVDAVVYGSGSFGGIIPHPGVIAGHSIERSPRGKDTDNCALDFIDQVNPTPGAGI